MPSNAHWQQSAGRVPQGTTVMWRQPPQTQVQMILAAPARGLRRTTRPSCDTKGISLLDHVLHLIFGTHNSHTCPQLLLWQLKALFKARHLPEFTCKRARYSTSHSYLDLEVRLLVPRLSLMCSFPLARSGTMPASSDTAYSQYSPDKSVRVRKAWRMK